MSYSCINLTDLSSTTLKLTSLSQWAPKLAWRGGCNNLFLNPVVRQWSARRELSSLRLTAFCGSFVCVVNCRPICPRRHWGTLRTGCITPLVFASALVADPVNVSIVTGGILLLCQRCWSARLELRCWGFEEVTLVADEMLILFSMRWIKCLIKSDTCRISLLDNLCNVWNLYGNNGCR